MTEIHEEYWTKRDGTRIAVGDMDVEHLRNTLRMIIRKRRERVTRLLLPMMTDEELSDKYWENMTRNPLWGNNEPVFGRDEPDDDDIVKGD